MPAAPISTLRVRPLFWRYWILTSGLVCGVLLVFGLADIAFAYRENARTVAVLQESAARAMAARIEEHLKSTVDAVRNSIDLPWDPALLDSTEQRREYRRLLNVAPAVREIRLLDRQGRERLFVSRTDVDRMDTGLVYRGADALRLSAGSTQGIGRPYFRDESEPYVPMTFLVSAPEPGYAAVEVHLGFVTELLEAARRSTSGEVYVLGAEGHVLAHTDPGVVHAMRLEGALARMFARPVGGDLRGNSRRVAGLRGTDVLASAAPLRSTDWLVIVEQPFHEVMTPAYESAARLAIAVVIGLLVALVASRLLSRLLVRPITTIERQVASFGGGELGRRVDVAGEQEIQSLANTFNAMAQQLQEYTVGLEQKIAEKTAELEKANRHKSEFLASVSHELRTPLNAIIGMSEALAEQIFGPLEKKQAEYVSDIHTSGLHLLALIQDLLDLSKIEAGKMEVEVEQFEVAACLASAQAFVRDRAQRAQVLLSLDVDRSVAAWRADPRRFKQILLNLLSNAIKFTRAGGEVVLGARQTDTTLTVWVRDTGVGIAPEDLGSLFEEFRQLRVAGGASQEGTGLGLALTKRLVELHGGTITVESELGRGSTFTVVLPRIEDAEGKAAA